MDAFTDPGEHTKNHSEKTYEASLGALQVPVFKASTPQRDLQLQPLSQGQSSSLDSYLSHISPRYRTKCFVTGKKKASQGSWDLHNKKIQSAEVALLFVIRLGGADGASHLQAVF